MSTTINLTLGNPDPALKFTNYSDLFTVIRQQWSGSLDIDLSFFIKGNSTPAVEDQDKVWIRTDPEGRPLGNYIFFNGLWVREEPPVSARFGYYIGDPTDVFDGDGNGLPGPGPVALDYFGWHLVNGKDGTADLSDRFIICAHMNDEGSAGWSDGWRTDVTGTPLGTGGVSEITLDVTNTPAITVGLHDATGSSGSGGPLYGITDGTDTTIGGTTTPGAISVVNPFFAFAFIQFTGYKS